MLGVEARPLIADPDTERRTGIGIELDEDPFAGVVLVSGRDGGYDRLPDGHAHPVHRIVIETHVPADMVADDLHQVEHLERAGELQPQRTLPRH